MVLHFPSLHNESLQAYWLQPTRACERVSTTGQGAGPSGSRLSGTELRRWRHCDLICVSLSSDCPAVGTLGPSRLLESACLPFSDVRPPPRPAVCFFTANGSRLWLWVPNLRKGTVPPLRDKLRADPARIISLPCPR